MGFLSLLLLFLLLFFPQLLLSIDGTLLIVIFRLLVTVIVRPRGSLRCQIGSGIGFLFLFIASFWFALFLLGGLLDLSFDIFLGKLEFIDGDEDGDSGCNEQQINYHKEL
jgi:hypothetical protein